MGLLDLDLTGVYKAAVKNHLTLNHVCFTSREAREGLDDHHGLLNLLSRHRVQGKFLHVLLARLYWAKAGLVSARCCLFASLMRISKMLTCESAYF